MKRNLHCTATAVMLGLLTGPTTAQTTSITKGVLAGGGGSAQGATLSLHSTLAQTSSGIAAGTSTTLFTGFWGPLPPPLECPADVDRNGIASPADFTAWLAAFNAGCG